LNYDNNRKESTVSTKYQPKILVCIPAFNEAESISEVIRMSLKYASEVLVYDDGSTDGTYQVAISSGATAIRNPKNRGYGVAIRSLFREAKQKKVDITITTDSDGQHDPSQIPDFLKAMDQGFDVVIGSRFLKNEDKQKVPKFRSLGIKTFIHERSGNLKLYTLSENFLPHDLEYIKSEIESHWNLESNTELRKNIAEKRCNDYT